MLVIPGRPQTKEDLEVGKAYRDHIQRIASKAFTRVKYPDGFVKVDLEFYYPGDDTFRDRPLMWIHKSIPRADKAANIILTALSGLLYTHASQVNPLNTARFVLTPYECKKRFGSEAGAAVVRWQDA